MSLHTQILLGLVLGAVCGVTVNLFGGRVEEGLSELLGRPVQMVQPLLTYVTEPLGQVFLRMLLMTVIPLVFASLALGVAKLGDLRHLGRIGARTMGYFVVSMAIAVVIGLSLVNLIEPGVGLPEETRTELLARYGRQASERAGGGTSFGISTFVSIVPRNPLKAAVDMDMLGVIFFALMVGVGLTMIDPERSRVLQQILEGIGDVMVVIIGLAMRLAPYGVFALLFTVTALLGLPILGQLGKYVFVVLLGLAIHLFGVFSLLVWGLSRLNPWLFFRRVRAVIVTAFSTSSSSATLPTSIKIAEEELGVPTHIAGFVLPLGATMNMNGTALFEGVTAVFLAQVFGVPLSLSDQAVIIVLSVLTAIGAAGVPGGSLPLLVLVIASVGVPPEGIAIIIGVDRLLDMCRTTLNVVGDITAATYIARTEGYELLRPPPATDEATLATAIREGPPESIREHPI
jgi:DAACS family dicarboxylate/amino acid:cation (Na+ or H+) symporter